MPAVCRTNLPPVLEILPTKLRCESEDDADEDGEDEGDEDEGDEEVLGVSLGCWVSVVVGD